MTYNKLLKDIGIMVIIVIVLLLLAGMAVLLLVRAYDLMCAVDGLSLENNQEPDEDIFRQIVRMSEAARHLAANQINDTDFACLQEVVGTEQLGNEADLLDADELHYIDRLPSTFAAAKGPVSPETKSQLERLKTRSDQYRVLLNSLEEVAQGLDKNVKKPIADQLIACTDVETPILLVKQYQQKEQWHAVPACSYVTDKNNLLDWLTLNPLHPVNHDFLRSPTQYKGKTARYRWHYLTKDYCSAQELKEAVTDIRDLLDVLSDKLAEINTIDHRVASSSQSMFYTPIDARSGVGEGQDRIFSP